MSSGLERWMALSAEQADSLDEASLSEVERTAVAMAMADWNRGVLRFMKLRTPGRKAALRTLMKFIREQVELLDAIETS